MRLPVSAQKFLAGTASLSTFNAISILALKNNCDFNDVWRYRFMVNQNLFTSLVKLQAGNL